MSWTDNDSYELWESQRIQCWFGRTMAKLNQVQAKTIWDAKSYSFASLEDNNLLCDAFLPAAAKDTVDWTPVI